MRNYLPSVPFLEEEVQMNQKLAALFREWSLSIDNRKEKFRDLGSENLVFDGFYPGYSQQKVKILFIGRECRGLEGHNYIEVLWKSYTEDFKIGTRSLNQSKFHRLMLYCAYALNREVFDWNQIPSAVEIGKILGTKNPGEIGPSFSFMNLSKFSNEGKLWQSDWELIEHSIHSSTSGKDLIKEEIKILNPNLIITMNFGDRIQKIASCEPIGSIAPIGVSSTQNAVDVFRPQSSLLFDTYHFSAPSKGDRAWYFDPIIKAWNDFSKN